MNVINIIMRNIIKKKHLLQSLLVISLSSFFFLLSKRLCVSVWLRVKAMTAPLQQRKSSKVFSFARV